MAYELTENVLAFYELDDATDAHSTLDLTNNAAVTFTAGLVGNAGTFVAASSQYLNRNSVSITGSALTVGAWVKLTTKTAFRGFVSKFESTGDQRAFSLFSRSDVDKFAVAVSSAGTAATTTTLNSTVTPVTGRWYFVALVLTDAYLYSVVVDSTTDVWTIVAAAHTGGLFDSSADLRVGRYGNNYMDGQIDQVFISTRVWTRGDLEWYYNAGDARSYAATAAVFQRSIHDLLFVNSLTKYASNPILQKGSAATWDDYGIRDPIIMTDPDGDPVVESDNYLVYYNANSDSTTKAIGRATAPTSDHKTLTKYVSNPVLQDSTYAALGSVIKLGASSYILYYSPDTSGGFKYRTSSDGISWGAASSYILTPANFTSISAMGLPFVTQLSSGTWYMVFEGAAAGGFRIFMATSADGLAWSAANSGNAIYSAPSVGWDSLEQANPSLYELAANSYVILYNGEPASNTWAIGALYSTNLTTWTRFTFAPIIPRGASGQWDDQRLEGYRIFKSDVGSAEVRGYYFGLPGTDSNQDGAIGYVTAEQPDALTHYTLSAEQGAYTLAGQTLLFAATRLLSAAQGSYTLAGQNANLLYARLFSASHGAYALTGQAVTLIWSGEEPVVTPTERIYAVPAEERVYVVAAEERIYEAS